MKALQIVRLSGPEASLEQVDLQRPSQLYDLFGTEPSVRIKVHSAGVSFPELLQTEGRYQYQPEVPFTPGSEVAGVVLEAHEGSGFVPGQRVTAFCGSGAWAEEVLAPASLTFALPDHLSFAEGAGLVMNYHTAYFGLVTRGQFTEGERVLVHGAGGGLGSACVDVASALGAEVIAVVSTPEKAEAARACGAHHVLDANAWKSELDALWPEGVDLVLDPVGEPVAVDSLRSLRPFGRYIVLGFAGGGIPEIRVNRLLLRNISVVGAGWGAFAYEERGIREMIGAALQPLLNSGALTPQVGRTYRMSDASKALRDLQSRRAVGKLVLDISAEIGVKEEES